jgi:hypothetical protein
LEKHKRESNHGKHHRQNRPRAAVDGRRPAPSFSSASGATTRKPREPDPRSPGYAEKSPGNYWNPADTQLINREAVIMGCISGSGRGLRLSHPVSGVLPQIRMRGISIPRHENRLSGSRTTNTAGRGVFWRGRTPV